MEIVSETVSRIEANADALVAKDVAADAGDPAIRDAEMLNGGTRAIEGKELEVAAPDKETTRYSVRMLAPTELASTDAHSVFLLRMRLVLEI